MDFNTKINTEVSNAYPLLAPITNLRTDGTINRFDSVKIGDNAIWVCVHEFSYEGNWNWVAVFGSWREGTQHTIKSYNPGLTQEKKLYEAQKAAIKASQNRLEQEKMEKHSACREKWAPIFYGLPQNSLVHDYLKGKKVGRNFEARVDQKQDVLYIPAFNSKSEFVGAQRISKDQESGNFIKRFTYGIEKKGSFCPFGEIENAKFIYIAEGFATAASISAALNKASDRAVAAVFDTSNLLEGAKAIRAINPTAYLIFAADRDINIDKRFNNIGERKAQKASKHFSNAIVRTVSFSTPDDSFSDYNDLHQSEGLGAVLKQLHCEASDFTEIIPLGFNGNKHYYFASHRNQILEWGKSDHTPASFTMLAPEKYWGDRYGYVLKSDGTTSQNANFKKVIEGLGKETSEKGRFDYSKVRGIGAWEHEGSIIVNTGERLFYRGEYHPIHNNRLNSQYFYESGAVNKIDFSKPLSDLDSIKFVEAFKMLNYKNPSDFITILGWIYCAQIFAALPWRPHIWFTGPRGSGKSTILSYISDLIMFSSLMQDSTLAGILQSIKNSAVAIITDEAEPNTDRDRIKLQEILMLARQCSTKAEYKSLRGSASGQAITFNTNACFCMGSIQIPQMQIADKSRFFVIEMGKLNSQTAESFASIEKSLKNLKSLTPNLFVRAVTNFEAFSKNISKCKTVLRENGLEPRQADQFAAIISGYFGFYKIGEISESFILRTFSELDYENSEYSESNKESDEENCLNAILDLEIPKLALTVAQSIKNLEKPDLDYLNKHLEQYGLKYRAHEEDLLIFPGNIKLSEALKKSNIADLKSLISRHERLKFFERNGRKVGFVSGRINKKSVSCRAIDLRGLLE